MYKRYIYLRCPLGHLFTLSKGTFLLTKLPRCEYSFCPFCHWSFPEGKALFEAMQDAERQKCTITADWLRQNHVPHHVLQRTIVMEAGAKFNFVEKMLIHNLYASLDGGEVGIYDCRTEPMQTEKRVDLMSPLEFDAIVQKYDEKEHTPTKQTEGATHAYLHCGSGHPYCFTNYGFLPRTIDDIPVPSRPDWISSRDSGQGIYCRYDGQSTGTWREAIEAAVIFANIKRDGLVPNIAEMLARGADLKVIESLAIMDFGTASGFFQGFEYL